MNLLYFKQSKKTKASATRKGICGNNRSDKTPDKSRQRIRQPSAEKKTQTGFFSSRMVLPIFTLFAFVAQSYAIALERQNKRVAFFSICYPHFTKRKSSYVRLAENHYFCRVMHDKPKIAIIEPNTLAALGLAGLIEQMMPMAEACLFHDFDEMQEAGAENFFHYFIASSVLMEHAQFFLEHRRQTIVLIQGQQAGQLPSDFRMIDVSQSSDHFVRAFMQMEQAAHGAHRPQPEPVRRAQAPLSENPLTPRETEVLRLIVSGLTNKEVAARLNVGLTTVISHRKNLTEKLEIKSVSALTVYAVSRGLVKMEEI